MGLLEKIKKENELLDFISDELNFIEKNKLPDTRFQDKINEIKILLQNNNLVDAKKKLTVGTFTYFDKEYSKNYDRGYKNYFRLYNNRLLKDHIIFESKCLPLLIQNEEVVNKISRISDELTKVSKSDDSFIKLVFAILVFIYSIFAVFISDDYGRFMKFIFFILILISGFAVLFYYLVYADHVKYKKLIKDKIELESINKETIAKIIKTCNDNGIKIT